MFSVIVRWEEVANCHLFICCCIAPIMQQPSQLSETNGPVVLCGGSERDGGEPMQKHKRQKECS